MAEENGLLLCPCGSKHFKLEMRVQNKNLCGASKLVVKQQKPHEFHSFFTENLILQNTLFHQRNFPAMYMNLAFYRPVQ